ncbi:hypothetical protein GCM10009827_081700 [Dactylosporangium maewongense]|uniref:FHA domain-containing protein n=1 Tax=Dactylosporangium maewongense TaxID=634393 RepID=A0ABP4MRN3_9ACTN
MVQPLPGNGLVARAGDLFVVCEPAGCEELLALLDRVAADGGDGADLARHTAELLPAGELSCAAGGMTGDGGVAVFVCGHGVAELAGPHEEVRLSGPAPQQRQVAGPVSRLRLALPGAGAAHPYARLGAGVVTGAGLTARFARPQPAPPPARAEDKGAPFQSVLLLPGQPVPPPDDVPVVDTVALIEGVDCKNGHFNDPGLRFCQRCGIGMLQVTHVTRLGPRPPLGVLLLDNGMTLRVDTDYVVGREPAQDPDVLARRARPLRIADSHGGISRRHLRVKLAGWEVRVVDLGSANGTYLQAPGEAEAHRVPPGDSTVLRPGSKVLFGRRWLRYESHRNP